MERCASCAVTGYLLCKVETPWVAILNYHCGRFRGKRDNIHFHKSHQTLKDQIHSLYSNTVKCILFFNRAAHTVISTKSLVQDK